MESEKWCFTEQLSRLREQINTSGYDVYCLHCITGREVAAAQELNREHPNIITLPFLRLMHKSRNGVRELTQDTLLKGYVFVYTAKGTDISGTEKCRYVYKILGKREDERTLVGTDLKYAQWVLSLGGVVGLSKALKINEKVKIIEGPLLDYEGSIKEYSKKNRNCRVEIDVVGQQLSAWLPFDWVESERGMLDLMDLGE